MLNGKFSCWKLYITYEKYFYEIHKIYGRNCHSFSLKRPAIWDASKRIFYILFIFLCINIIIKKLIEVAHCVQTRGIYNTSQQQLAGPINVIVWLAQNNIIIYVKTRQ